MLKSHKPADGRAGALVGKGSCPGSHSKLAELVLEPRANTSPLLCHVTDQTTNQNTNLNLQVNSLLDSDSLLLLYFFFFFFSIASPSNIFT